MGLVRGCHILVGLSRVAIMTIGNLDETLRFEVVMSHNRIMPGRPRGAVEGSQRSATAAPRQFPLRPPRPLAAARSLAAPRSLAAARPGSTALRPPRVFAHPRSFLTVLDTSPPAAPASLPGRPSSTWEVSTERPNHLAVSTHLCNNRTHVRR